MDLSPEEVAALRSLGAKLTDVHDDVQRLAASGHQLGLVVQRITALVEEAYAVEVAQHPDLAELNVQLDGYYEAPPPEQ